MVRKYSKLKQIIEVILIFLLIISCNGQVSNKKNQVLNEDKEQTKNIKEQPPVDFFDQKYFNGYKISFGDEDISEHPYRYYYNYENKEIQWFAISYVPKNISLHKYWSIYLQGSSSNEATQSSTIEKIINKDLSSYNIFAVYIPKKYLDISNGVSEEAMFFKNNTELYFYLYDALENKWKFLKKTQTNAPLIGKRDFFSKQFPELFSLKKDLRLNDNKNISETENITLLRNFIFEFSISKIENEDGNEIQKVKINLKNKETNKIQVIDFTPKLLVTQFDGSSANSISYFGKEQSIIKSYQEIEGGHMLIALDVNFDGLEDFAIINYQGSNGGPQYAYYVQKANKQFVLDSYLTENVRFFPSEINKGKKILTIIYPSGCCQFQTSKFQIQSNGKWKNTYSHLENIK
ncbi:MAG: XAC2610-related protein [Flavobacterium sp.]|uniref:XAC2610-related protein n=1 Tax=Flavobacterium sp. TaxID=239 RepID=UPI003D1417FA